MPAASGSPMMLSIITLSATLARQGVVGATQLTMVMTATVPASASHLICCRCSPCDRRNLTTSETDEPTMPIATIRSARPSSGLMSGLSHTEGVRELGLIRDRSSASEADHEGAGHPDRGAPGDRSPAWRQETAVGEEHQQEGGRQQHEGNPGEVAVHSRGISEQRRDACQ